MDNELYLRLREKEGRIYSDDIVAHLPYMADALPHANEWRARAISSMRLHRYFSSKPTPLSLLELGCGNGWLSNLLSQSRHRVIGMDRNQQELKQAARIFQSNSKLLFLDADIFSSPFYFGQFDAIVLASVVQYFQNIHILLPVLLSYLKPAGEIHIIDSPFYEDGDLKEASTRTEIYYRTLGFSQMTEHYFHHRLSDLMPYRAQCLYAPKGMLHRLKQAFGQVDSPFPWYVIKN